MSVIGESGRLGDLGGLDGTNARRAGEYHKAALWIRQFNRVELRQRREERAADAFTRGLVGLAHIDQHDLVGGETFGHLFGRQVPDRAPTEQSVHQMPLADSCDRPNVGVRSKWGPNERARFLCVATSVTSSSKAGSTCRKAPTLRTQIVTWVPTSTTRPVRIWK